jgi:hypothetical protein
MLYYYTLNQPYILPKAVGEQLSSSGSTFVRSEASEQGMRKDIRRRYNV